MALVAGRLGLSVGFGTRGRECAGAALVWPGLVLCGPAVMVSRGGRPVLALARCPGKGGPTAVTGASCWPADRDQRRRDSGRGREDSRAPVMISPTLPRVRCPSLIWIAAHRMARAALWSPAADVRRPRSPGRSPLPIPRHLAPGRSSAHSSLQASARTGLRCDDKRRTGVPRIEIDTGLGPRSHGGPDTRNDRPKVVHRRATHNGWMVLRSPTRAPRQ